MTDHSPRFKEWLGKQPDETKFAYLQSWARKSGWEEGQVAVEWIERLRLERDKLTEYKIYDPFVIQR